jgi:hypothetical protein
VDIRAHGSIREDVFFKLPRFAGQFPNPAASQAR